MAMKITDGLMSSSITPHIAELKADGPAGKRSWVASWLPSRPLSFNQAITAMTLAEHVAATDAAGLSPEDSARWWGHVDGWAAELRVSSSFALAAIEDTLPGAVAHAPRCNHEGDPCPSWCVADHEQLLFINAPEHGYMSSHFSAPLLGGDGHARVLVVQSPGQEPVVTMIPAAFKAEAGLEFSVKNARMLAAFVADVGEPAVADALLAAANMLAGVMLRAAR